MHMSDTFKILFSSSLDTAVMYGIVIVISMFSALVVHLVTMAVVALKLGEFDEASPAAPASAAPQSDAAIAIAIAAAKRYQDNH
jgi:hypothetical protein